MFLDTFAFGLNDNAFIHPFSLLIQIAMMMSGCVIMVNAFRFQNDAITILIARMIYRMNVIVLVSFFHSFNHMLNMNALYHVVFYFACRLVSIFCMTH